MCDDCKYFPPLKKQQQYAIFYKLDLNKEMYIELQFANKKNYKYITTHFLFNPFLHICCTDSDASEVANLQASLRLCLSLKFWGSSNACLLIESFFQICSFSSSSFCICTPPIERGYTIGVVLFLVSFLPLFSSNLHNV